MLLRNRTTNDVIALDVQVAKHWWQRVIGLLDRRTLEPFDGMWFPNSWAIHTIGMRAQIDVIFVDEENRVMRVRPNVRRNCFAIACMGAAAVIELGAGALESTDMLIGDRLTLEP